MKKKIKHIMEQAGGLVLVAAFCLGWLPAPPAQAAGEPSAAMVSVWGMQTLAGAELAAYDSMFRVYAKSAGNNGGKYGASTLDKAWDEDRNSHWETGTPNSSSFKNRIDFTFAKAETIGRIVYGARSDAGNKGFAKRFEIWGSLTETGEDFALVSTGTANTSSELVEITFPQQRFLRLRFVWVEAQNDWASARCFYFYKEDLLAGEIRGIFTDDAGSSLRADVTAEQLSSLQERLNSYPQPGNLQPYLNLAAWLLSGGGGSESKVHEPMTLGQRGDRGAEKNRTGTGMTLAGFDLAGYYALPGEQLEVFVDADPKGPMPRLVLAAVCQNTAWAFTYDGKALSNGYNVIEVPKTMASCQAIYFYNPARPDQQAFAPTVRLIGGTKYPVYRYDAKDSDAVTRAKEAAFVQELTTYVAGVTDDYNEAKVGRGNYNICEYVSDKILISVSARGALKSLKAVGTWNMGDWQSFVDKARFGTVEKDSSGQPTGIRYTGPAAVMECYEMLFDDIQLYSGFNLDNPAHPDYRNYGQFLFRAYNDGSGLGWGQNVYSGYNTGSQPNGSKWDSGFYSDLVTVNTVLSAGWAVFHEIGHVFDSGIIGTSESTNNLYGLMAQLKYKGINRLGDPGENRWYGHFTTYINTGVLPQNDLLFYPGAVIYQLDAVDFSQSKLYQDTAAGDDLMSNYGMACRYARAHRNQINSLSYTDKLVLCFSMACGVDLSTHFGYYGRTISDETRRLLAGLPKETRPTWLVNDRTFVGEAFSAEDKGKAPVIKSTTVNENTGAVTLTMAEGVFKDRNLQCFAVYRQELDENGQLIGTRKWIGISGDNKSTKAVNELYQFVDPNVVPGKTYRYTVGAYDCTLNEAPNYAEVDAIIGANANVPLTRLLINNGDEGKTFNVGNTYPMQAVFFPDNATIDLNSIRWWVEGYGRDGAKTGGGPDTITLTEDPNYPGDPTRRLATGIQNGQTHVMVSVGGLTQTYRMVTNGSLAVDPASYELSFAKDELSVQTGATANLSLQRVTKSSGVTVNVATTPSGVTWESSNTAVATVTNRGVATAVAPGETTISFCYKNQALASCKLTVTAAPVPLTGIVLSGEQELKVGTTARLLCSLQPGNTTETQKPVWTSNDTAVVRVDQAGTITALKSGAAEITATIGGISGKISITVPDYIPLKGLAMQPGEAVMLTESQKTVQLFLVKNPADATASEMIWKSDAPAIATVDNMGLVTAVSGGTTVITAYLDGKSVTCTVTVDVDVPLTGVKFKDKAAGESINVSLKAEESYQLMLYPVPIRANGLSQTEWITSNSSVATVKEGYVTAIGEGSAQITARITQNTGTAGIVVKEVVCELTVAANTRPLTGLGINRSSAGLGKGDTLELTITNQPTNANRASDRVSEIGVTAWESSSPAVATVDQNGVVTAVGEGESSITARRGGLSIQCSVVVRKADVPAASIDLDQESLHLTVENQDGVTLKAEVLPLDTTAAPYWTTSDAKVARVDQLGRVTPVAEGTAQITAAVSGKSAHCTVTVTMQDVQGPAAPPRVWTEQLTATSAELHWEAAVDNVGVTKYRIALGDAAPTEVDSDTLLLALVELASGLEYTATVTALDAAGNASAAAQCTFTTLDKAEQDNAEMPRNLEVGEVSATLATLTWDAPTGTAPVAAYQIYLNNIFWHRTPSDNVRYVLEGLIPDTLYHVKVTAVYDSLPESLPVEVQFTTSRAPSRAERVQILQNGTVLAENSSTATLNVFIPDAGQQDNTYGGFAAAAYNQYNTTMAVPSLTFDPGTTGVTWANGTIKVTEGAAKGEAVLSTGVVDGLCAGLRVMVQRGKSVTINGKMMEQTIEYAPGKTLVDCATELRDAVAAIKVMDGDTELTGTWSWRDGAAAVTHGSAGYEAVWRHTGDEGTAPYAEASFTITIHALKTLSGADFVLAKSYDGTTTVSANNVTVDNTKLVTPTDVVTLDSVTATYDTKDVGTGKTVSFTAATLKEGADKYRLANALGTAKGEITRAAAVTLAYPASSGSYDLGNALPVDALIAVKGAQNIEKFTQVFNQPNVKLAAASTDVAEDGSVLVKLYKEASAADGTKTWNFVADAMVAAGTYRYTVDIGANFTSKNYSLPTMSIDSDITVDGKYGTVTYKARPSGGGDDGGSGSGGGGGGNGGGVSEYIITATATKGGTITPNGNVSVPSGVSQPFTIIPDGGYAVKNILVDGKSVGAVTGYTFKEVEAAHSISASFEPLPIEAVRGYLDVSDSEWFFESVYFVKELGLMNGVGDGNFAPNLAMNRGMVWTVLYRQAGAPAVPGTDPNLWYDAAQKWAISVGVSDGSDPNVDITREQLVVMLWRHMGSPAPIGALPTNSDFSQVSDFAVEAMHWAVAQGIVKGDEMGRLLAQNSTSRAEVATMLTRYIPLLAK